jgi:hypothetical protein
MLEAEPVLAQRSERSYDERLSTKVMGGCTHGDDVHDIFFKKREELRAVHVLKAPFEAPIGTATEVALQGVIPVGTRVGMGPKPAFKTLKANDVAAFCKEDRAAAFSLAIHGIGLAADAADVFRIDMVQYLVGVGLGTDWVAKRERDGCHSGWGGWMCWKLRSRHKGEGR